MLLSLAALLLPAPAQAFCGHYVGQAGAELYNGASQLAVTRQEGRTTLTLVNDFQGNLSEFALLVPVPEVLSEDDVNIVDPAIIGRVDAYSAPRLVSYTCEDFSNDWDADGATSDTGAEGGAGAGADDSVTVEAEFSAGEYQIVILSAQESSALLEWLAQNEYAVDSSAEALLQEYIEGGAYFFAARVALEALPDGQSYLSPLQFGYEAEAFSLPIRLGTLNSAGEQDLIVYALSDAGQTHISNYPEVEVEDECMYVDSDWESFVSFYNDRFGEAARTEQRAGWILEYGWSPAGCDPCADDPLTQEELEALGWQGDASEAYLTRLHMRYSPDQVDQDLVFYGSGLRDTSQVRYILYEPALEDRFPLCISGWADDPGSCEDVNGDPGQDPEGQDTGGAEGPSPEAKRSCGLPVAANGWLALLALGLIRRRRR
ncbi:MAG: DUF2330 domain-containing protein [Alphaproteobacteria bacterium]|nr:DUF2330 domain-containing protein [Alphaproteobacteria bacterium]